MHAQSRPQPNQPASSQPKDKKRRHDDAQQKSDEIIDEASDESFPASDPPAWTDTSASKNDG